MTDNQKRLRVTRPRRWAGPRPGGEDLVRPAVGPTATDGGQPIGESHAARSDHFITCEDMASELRRNHRELEAFRIALMKIRERQLPMKLTRVELASDARLIFYFTAEARVDFRDLVKELAAEFRTRIEMRQIGVRDEAKMLGGYGSCGRPLCCASWLGGFEPVSIKMAKVQDLTLNPTKLSGLCSRLKCCLRFELTDERLLKRGPRPSDGQPSGNGDEC